MSWLRRPSRLFSMRWWLAAVFAALVALTAIAVAEVVTTRSQQAFRNRGEDLAVGAAVRAAANIGAAEASGQVREATAGETRARRIALFVFDRAGNPVTGDSSNGVSLESVPERGEALKTALSGNRFVQSEGDRPRIVVGLPLTTAGGGAVIAVASRPDLFAAADIVRGQLARTVGLAILIGALLGTLVAIVITSRLRRVARAAATIEDGNFDVPLESAFQDEVGQLASTVDAMRLRLRESFAGLAAERDRLQSLLERLQEGVIAVDAGLCVAFANSRAALLAGRGPLEAGQPLPELWAGIPLRELAAGLFAPGASVSNTRVSPDRDHTYSVVGIPLRPPADSALLVITDITVADRRERAEREFVTNAAHELRTPLAAIAAAVDVLQSGAKEVTVDRDRFLAVVERQSGRLTRLVRSLLTLARAQTRAEPLLLEPVDVSQLLAEISAELRDDGDVDVEIRTEAGLTAHSHHDLLAQAVGNLAANAVKYGGGPPILLQARSLPDGRVRIEVRDAGPGIGDLERDRVFDRFYRAGDRTADGFGLGLPIVQAVAAAIGGDVEIRSGEDEDTVAAIVVPGRSNRR